jgi:hypothetical protein
LARQATRLDLSHNRLAGFFGQEHYRRVKEQERPVGQRQRAVLKDCLERLGVNQAADQR